MPCGKRPLVKNWDKPRSIRVITPSRYEQNEASVKQHWKKVIRDLEDSYKDDQFWESNCDTVRHLVGPIFFQRIAKIFNLPLEAKQYQPEPDITSLVPSELFYKNKVASQYPCEAGAGRYSQIKLQIDAHLNTLITDVSWCQMGLREGYSMSDFELPVAEEEYTEGEQSDQWSVSSVAESVDLKKTSQAKSLIKSKSFTMSRSFSKMPKSFSKYIMSKTLQKTYSSRMTGYRSQSTIDESASSDDDVHVHPHSMRIRSKSHVRRTKNPHFEMLYCNESETDMIKWKSKYKQKTFEVSASDEFSKKAEIMTKKISKEFYDWWVSLGNVEFKSEIKRPEDIEDLFQVWFDEHASRGLTLDPKILPCVLQSIANYAGVPRASCPRVLKRQIAFDIHAETSPAHVMAFGTCLPQRMKHIPPKNNTEAMWHCVKIPEDLKSMACVWDDVQHLTSTKAFHKWLQQRPHLPMPPCLKALDAAGDKKQLFVVPSDYMVKDKASASSVQELALPVSQFSLELKEVLSKLMNQ